MKIDDFDFRNNVSNLGTFSIRNLQTIISFHKLAREVLQNSTHVKNIFVYKKIHSKINKAYGR